MSRGILLLVLCLSAISGGMSAAQIQEFVTKGKHTIVEWLSPTRILVVSYNENRDKFKARYQTLSSKGRIRFPEKFLPEPEEHYLRLVEEMGKQRKSLPS